MLLWEKQLIISKDSRTCGNLTRTIPRFPVRSAVPLKTDSTQSVKKQNKTLKKQNRIIGLEVPQSPASREFSLFDLLAPWKTTLARLMLFNLIQHTRYKKPLSQGIYWEPEIAQPCGCLKCFITGQKNWLTKNLMRKSGNEIVIR